MKDSSKEFNIFSGFLKIITLMFQVCIIVLSWIFYGWKLSIILLLFDICESIKIVNMSTAIMVKTSEGVINKLKS